MITLALPLSLSVLVVASTIAAACPTVAENRVDIYPTAKELPANLLRLYIYFPRAMTAEEGSRHVALLDDKGARVNGAFLATNQELWSPDRDRLTLLLDPGRVKSGLAAHEVLGRALVPGQSYTLVISGAAIDARGCPLGADVVHNFSVVGPDYDTPNPVAWSIGSPRVNSSEPVKVDLGSTHDHLSMAYRLRVVDDKSEIVPGAIELGPEEKSWHFVPREPWAEVTYNLVVDERLEDLAGNRPGVLFDRPVSAEPTEWQSHLSFLPTKDDG
ncbi:hypothetical protein SLH49_11420 [Cognatiyoonia sp. IB215446]|uniref:hypothetical protein n=1 Tax=Cognatiyoonia sp. IB215446 TaxID=3097355 RepID=UPI002A0F72C6|nr:hypothetical protein [Cognatiyoonia sp. IB215446]MDX8348596.1 hypothetical protein [Cognatiyoonia sp. IB215446]